MIAPEVEEICCLRLKSLVEEFSAERVTVAVPESWEKSTNYQNLGRVKLLYLTKDSIDISVAGTTIRVSEPLRYI